MNKRSLIPEELIKIKADQIGKKRESQGKVKTLERQQSFDLSR